MARTKDLLLAEGMRLFGERGYAATSVAQIEEAAGLSPGSGSLYKHFRTKEELLSEGLDRLLAGGRDLAERLGVRDSADPVAELTSVVHAGLRRMEEDRDANRVLFRDLDAFPDLLGRFGQGEIVRFHHAITAMLIALAGEDGKGPDWEAVTVVLQGATAHYWLLADRFGGHPTGVGEQRFANAAAVLIAALIAGARSGAATAATAGAVRESQERPEE
ncbi:TetR/AcrR family transcriptional regulator [Streptomonospora sp. PA3]|uniref:TetR/AcrR family transcriptional regulator n=1 Tax=Streptomonospora sp. PA3 TaxID=2607326 RepID=UPI0012DC4CE0|nr:TetR/AcrR family transcriptional regulator [Streptomonospora sp. PA3]MUL43051.1 TetR/AcrR family transcriptional regulator [Streptomonospora sp. PA3]